MPNILDEIIALKTRGTNPTFGQPYNPGMAVTPDMFRTPGFNPAAGMGEANAFDPTAALSQSDATTQNLIAQLMQMAQPPAPQKQGFVQTLLQSLPQAIAVGLSNDPGASLLKQINDASVLQQRQKERQEDFQRQLTFQVLGDQLGEQRQVRGDIRRSQMEEAANVRRFERDYRLQETRDVREFEQRKKLANIEQQGRLELARQNRDTQLAVAELEIQNKQSADTIRLTSSYSSMGVPASKAYDIAQKRIKGQPLTKEEEALENQAAAIAFKMANTKDQLEIQKLQAQIAATNRSNRGGGGGGGTNQSLTELAKLKQKIIFDAMTTQYGVTSGGQIVEASSVPADFTGNKPITYISAEQAFEKVARPKLDAIDKLMGVGPTQTQVPQGRKEVQGNPATITSDYFKNAINVLKKQGFTNDGILDVMKQNADAYPGARYAIDKAVREMNIKPEPKNRRDIIQSAPATPNLILPENLGGAKTINQQNFPTQSKRNLNY